MVLLLISLPHFLLEWLSTSAQWPDMTDRVARSRLSLSTCASHRASSRTDRTYQPGKDRGGKGVKLP